MLLSRADVELFVRLRRELMHFVNQRLGVVAGVANSDEFSRLSPKYRLDVRKAFLDHVDLIDTFVDGNPANLSNDELDMVSSWRHHVTGRFYVLRELKNYTIFLDAGDPAVAYGVVAITDPFAQLIGTHLPQMVETMLLPFQGKIVYDGIMSSYNISFGGGTKRILNDCYRQAKERLRIVTSLPIESTECRCTARTIPQKQKVKTKASDSSDVQQVLRVIVALTDDVCQELLNDEYADLCRKLAEKLARKRPSPLLRGQPRTWACGIIRTIGWVNFLDDRTTQPHLKLTAIDKALGVAESTGQGKSLEIRKLLKIHQLEPDWTLPSQMGDNPMTWILDVNGYLIDVRHAPREFQVIAFEKGLIPYIPADRKTTC